MQNWAYCLKCNHVLKLRVNSYQHRCSNCKSDRINIFRDFEIKNLIFNSIDNGRKIKKEKKIGSEIKKVKPEEKPEIQQERFKLPCLGIHLYQYEKCNYCPYLDTCIIERNRLRGGKT